MLLSDGLPEGGECERIRVGCCLEESTTRAVPPKNEDLKGKEINKIAILFATGKYKQR